MTGPDELMRSVAELRTLLDSMGSAAVSQAVELTRLDRLVRRYPAAARRSLDLLDRELSRRDRRP